MVDWNRTKLIHEMVSVIEEKFRQGKLEIEQDDLKKIIEGLNVGDSVEENKSKILYLAWHIPPGALPLAAEAVISLLVKEVFEKD